MKVWVVITEYNAYSDRYVDNVRVFRSEAAADAKLEALNEHGTWEYDHDIHEATIGEET